MDRQRSVRLVPALLWLAASGACLQVSGLDKISIGSDAGSTKACTSATDCDDKDSCTADACTGGLCTYTPTAEGSSCNALGVAGTCKGGACRLACKTTVDCPTPNPCQSASCDVQSGNCVFTSVPDGNPVSPTPGGCADGTCMHGVPTSPTPAGASCSTYLGSHPGFCDGAGSCLACGLDANCPGTMDDCQHPACSGGACGAVFTPMGTPTSSQTSLSCKKTVCDGMGSQVDVADDSKPLTPLPCFMRWCSNGNLNAAPTPGTTCGTVGQMCDAMGQCSCTTDSDCDKGFYCNGSGMGSCVMTLESGAMCTRNAMCSSGNCQMSGTCM